MAEVEALVDGILAGKRSGADTVALESALDGLVFGLYGLSAAEAGYVLGALGR